MKKYFLREFGSDRNTQPYVEVNSDKNLTFDSDVKVGWIDFSNGYIGEEGVIITIQHPFAILGLDHVVKAEGPKCI